MQQVLYTTRWNRLTRRPTMDHAWVSPQEAATLYASDAGIDVVDAERRDEDGTPRPVWVIGTSPVGFRVQLFTPGGAVARVVDWKRRDGRLWRDSSTEYLYPDEDTAYRMADATTIVDTVTRPDGTATLAYTDESGQTHVTEFADVATDGNWLDVPEFGDWGPLVNATLGASPGPPS